MGKVLAQTKFAMNLQVSNDVSTSIFTTSFQPLQPNAYPQANLPLFLRILNF